MTSADNDEHNHRLTEPDGIHGRKNVRTLCDHVEQPPILLVLLGATSPNAQIFVARPQSEICSNLNSYLLSTPAIGLAFPRSHDGDWRRYKANPAEVHAEYRRALWAPRTRRLGMRCVSAMGDATVLPCLGQDAFFICFIS